MLDHTKGTAYTLTVSRRFSSVVTEYEQRDVIVEFKTGEKVRCRVPKTWSDNAAATLMSKYAVRAGVPNSMGGVNGREADAEMIFRRLVAGWRAAAIEHGYWDADDENLAAFCDEIKAMLEQQRAAPNSPQWFNTGVAVQYGIKAGSDGHYYATTNPDGTATAHACDDSLAHPQISACFIQSVSDQLVGDGGIMDLWQREARLFKYGSGSGANYSALRGKGEPLSRGGASSGLLSFLRVGDRSAGAIKSGGTTRRSARMVIVDADHPDIEEFVAWKSHEDDKIRALHKAGYGDPSSFEDEATETVSGQNANNSVAVTDAFMQAAINCEPWDLHARVDGHVTATINAADLWHSIADAAWKCADPGLQFADTINRWHTCKADGPIRAANPCCLVQNTLVHTENGYVRIGDLAAMHDRGDALPRVWCWSDDGLQLRQCLRAWKAGDAKVLRVVETERGLVISCTPEHPFLLTSGEYVEAQSLREGDALRGSEDDRVKYVSGIVYCVPGESREVFDVEVEGVHNFLVTNDVNIAPVVVHNSEYVFLDDTACNLASINLAKFHVPGTVSGFDWDGYEHAARLWTVVLDISVSMAGYPTAEIARRSMLYRTLGLGYAALGELLVMLGLGYGTVAGCAFAADVTSTLTRTAYLTSSELARRLGTFPRYNANKEHVLEVLNMHAQHAPECEREGWQQVYVNALTHGVRNAQVSLLAPCGTIGIVMGCETTGVEPYYSDTAIKQLAGGGVMRLAAHRFADTLAVNGYEPEAYTRRAYTVEGGKVREYVWIEPPKALANVLVCADDLSPLQHVDMMAAVQPFLSGAISKTVNMPSTATVDDVARMYEHAWHKGLKSIAIYRDGCKPSQPLQGRKPAPGVKTYATREEAEHWRDALVPESVPITVRVVEARQPARGERVEPPTTARAVKHRVELSGHTFYLILGEHDDGSLAEVFVTCSRTGSAIAGWVNAWAKLFSLALQHGTPLDVLVSAMRGESFEPVGYHDGRPMLSPVDCFARIIEARYLADSDAPTHEPTEQDTAPLFSGSVEQFAKTTPFTVAAVRDAMNKPTGQTCVTCSSTDLTRSGACFVCRKCGSTTGCS